ncbi:hypothetical protein C8039_13985 [Halogeometricum sp. wsp3]|nr:hypothetical protein C8039_13985 [Halogeometricum sp. wsp3]
MSRRGTAGDVSVAGPHVRFHDAVYDPFYVVNRLFLGALGDPFADGWSPLTHSLRRRYARRRYW